MKISAVLGAALLVPGLVVLGAGLATAEDATPTPAPSESAVPAAPTASPEPPGQNPAATPTTIATPAPGSTSAPSSGDPTAGPGTPTITATATPTLTPSPSPTPEPEFQVDAVINGLPGRLVAGRTTSFSVTFKNQGSKSVHLGPVIGFGFDGLKAGHVRLEVREGDRWRKTPVAAVEEVPGLVVAPLTEEPVKLAPDATFTKQVRVTFATNAPRGGGAALLFGFDVDNDDELVAFTGQDVRLVGSSGGEDEPRKPGKKWTPPKGGPSDTAAKVKDEALAETGAGNGFLPVALVGAGLVAAGAGALIVVRRRRGGAGQPA